MEFSVAIYNGKNVPYDLNEKLLGLTLLERQIKIAEAFGAKEVITVNEETQRDFSGKWLFVNGAFFIHKLAVEQQYFESDEDRFEKGGMFGFFDAEKHKEDIAEFLKNGVFPENISTFTGPGYRVVVDSKETKKRLDFELFEEMRKPTNGLVSRSINMVMAIFLTRNLWIPLRFTPNMVTWCSIIVGVLSGFVAFSGSRLAIILGTLCAQIASVIDDCDGKVARLTYKTSDFGQWLDTVGDSFVNTSLTIGLGYGLAHYYTANPVSYAALQPYLESWPIWIAWLSVAINWYHNFVSYFDVIVIRKTTNIFSFTFWFEKKKRVVKRVDLTAPIYAKMDLLNFLKYFSRRDTYLFAYFVLALIGPAAMLVGYLITAAFVIPVFFLTTIHIYFGIIKKMRKAQ